MTPPPGGDLRPDVLARLLLIQSTAGQLPRDAAVVDFVCRGLELLPGVGRASHVEMPVDPDPSARLQRFTVQYSAQHYGEIVLQLTDPEPFLPYAPYVANLVFMVAVILEERRQYRLAESYQRELESRVEERTRQLTLEVRERRAAEAAAVAEKQRSDAYLAIAEAIIVELDTEARIVVLNARGCDLLGVPLEEALGRNWFELAIPPEERGATQEVFGRVLRGEVELPDYYDSTIISRSGARYVVAWHNTARREGGRVVGTLSSGLDITGRMRADEERTKLEAQLRESQRMDSIGRLAGGVAHDFNNMLAVILGHVELALDQVAPAQPLHADLTEIRDAASRSADLTSQLLAFARKQVIAPKTFDLNGAVGGMLKMLRRLIGEDIDLAWHPGSGEWPVRMDPSQLDQILANLCVNSRDAIGGVGKVAIDTRGATLDEAYCATHVGAVPGEYVKLSVADDGCGMDEETLGRVFEPFFTTKGVGRGTGLGLATVYGAVRQNDGFIDVTSKPGQGTTFAVYLPRCASYDRGTGPEGSAGPSPGGRETILLVEDERAILSLTTRMLERQGYVVLSAATPGEALRLAREHGGELHLLMTDLVMPEMNGRDLANNVLSLKPQIKRLFMSGYTADVIAHRGVLDEGVSFIQKPFSVQDLAVKVRNVLNGEPDARGR